LSQRSLPVNVADADKASLTGLTAAAISVILIGYGVMSALGNILGGRFADRSLKATLLMALALIGLRRGGVDRAAAHCALGRDSLVVCRRCADPLGAGCGTSG
jgi:MFS family permease